MLEKKGCQPKFVKMIRLLHLDMTGQILCSNELLEAYRGRRETELSFVQPLLPSHAVARCPEHECV